MMTYADNLNTTINNIHSNLYIGSQILFAYKYNDDNFPEGFSIVSWYRSSDYGITWDLITSHQTSQLIGSAYFLTNDDLNKYIKVSIIPKNTNGDIGIEVEQMIGIARYEPQVPVITQIGIKILIGESIQEITQPLYPGDKLVGTWTYTDVNNDPEGNHIFRWYRSLSDDIDGSYIVIRDSNDDIIDSSNYTITEADVGKHIKFEMIPISI